MDIIKFDCHKGSAPAYSCNKPGDNTGYYIRLDEGFKEAHLDALQHIVGLMNDCEDSEAEILAFANQLRKKYAG